MADLYPTLIVWALCAVIIGVATLIVGRFIRQYKSSAFLARKALHTIAVTSVGIAIHQSSSYRQLLAYLLIVLGLLLVVAVHRRWLDLADGDSYGVGLFAISLGMLLSIEAFSVDVILISAAILAIADPLAGIVGTYLGRIRWRPLAESKSVVGSTTFALATGLILYAGPISITTYSLAVLVVAISLSELLSAKGSDNLSIPIVAACLLQHIELAGDLDSSTYHLALAALSIPVGWIIYQRHWLDAGGIAAAVALAIAILIGLGPVFLLFPLLFLVIGSLLSKLPCHQDQDAGGRNAKQVLSNGLCAIVLCLMALVNDPTICDILFILSLGIPLTDTVSSEIGRRYGRSAWDIVRWQVVPHGLSGGVSGIGTLAGLLTAVIYTGCTWILMDIDYPTAAAIAVFSFAGMLIDSILGSALQAKYKQNGVLSDDGDELARGYRWVTNDRVNLLSIALTIVIAWIVLA